jgi:hypothetical protein
MTIPDAQLEIWSHQGAITTSKDTYATVKRALENQNTGYANQQYKVFLQGSYGNDTNIFAESDVDIVICYLDAFFYDLEHLPADQQKLFKTTMGDAPYAYNTFKAHVLVALAQTFGDSVQPSKNAFKIAAYGTRRSADVICAFRHRRYTTFAEGQNPSFYEGITFETADGKRVHNFPEYHSQNLTAKHQRTGNRFKGAIRVFKNMRSKLIENGAIAKGEAPSYFIEGLLSNVPDEVFSGSIGTTTFNILTWLYQTPDRTNFLCANKCYYLLRDVNSVCWPPANGTNFIDAAIALWNNW